MARLPTQTLSTIFDLQRRLIELIDEAKAAELNLFERFGDQLDDIKEVLLTVIY